MAKVWTPEEMADLLEISIEELKYQVRQELNLTGNVKNLAERVDKAYKRRILNALFDLAAEE